MDKPFSQACENNKAPILEVLSRYLTEPAQLLEVGTGTGQHAVNFARALPHVLWQTSDLEANHEGILAWMAEFPSDNLRAPMVLDVSQPGPMNGNFDAVYTANTLHIMSWPEVLCFFSLVGELLRAGGCCFIYGPFNYGGSFTSDSNRQFDAHLKTTAPHRGIRDFEAICELAEKAGMQLQEDVAMPSNNRCLVFRKLS